MQELEKVQSILTAKQPAKNDPKVDQYEQSAKFTDILTYWKPETLIIRKLRRHGSQESIP